MLTVTTAMSLVVSWLIYSRASRSMSGAEVEVEPVEAELEDHADLRQCCATGGDRTALELRLGRVDRDVSADAGHGSRPSTSAQRSSMAVAAAEWPVASIMRALTTPMTGRHGGIGWGWHM